MSTADSERPGFPKEILGLSPWSGKTSFTLICIQKNTKGKNHVRVDQRLIPDLTRLFIGGIAHALSRSPLA